MNVLRWWKRAPWGQWACVVGAVLPLNHIEETGSVAAAVVVAAFALSGAALRMAQVVREGAASHGQQSNVSGG